MGNSFYYFLLVFNCFFYGFCCLIILKRRFYTCFTVRSPPLLLIGNLCGFFLSMFIILFQILNEKFNNILIFFFYIFQVMMILSFILRIKRFVKFNYIEKNKKYDMKVFSKKGYLYYEKYYVKLLLFGTIIFIFILLVVYFIFGHLINIISLNIEDTAKNNELKILNSYIWLFIIFFEFIVFIYYAFIELNDTLKQKLNFELNSFIFIWFVYWNFINWIYFNIEIENKKLLYFIASIICLYLCLLINGYYIIYFSYHNTHLNEFFYNPQLMNNLYLFLLNEECYKYFSEYLSIYYNNDIFYLQLYIQILNYKLMFYRKKQLEQNQIDEANNIYNKFFANDTYQDKILIKVYSSIRRKANEIMNPKDDLFDEALRMCYFIIKQRYIEFKKTRSFQTLYNYYNLISYIYCKMINCGLIKKD